MIHRKEISVSVAADICYIATTHFLQFHTVKGDVICMGYFCHGYYFDKGVTLFVSIEKTHPSK